MNDGPKPNDNPIEYNLKKRSSTFFEAGDPAGSAAWIHEACPITATQKKGGENDRTIQIRGTPEGE